jgi:hypothetical protein
VCGELASVIAADVLRNSTPYEQVASSFKHILAGKPPGNIDRQAFSGVLVHNREHPE